MSNWIAKTKRKSNKSLPNRQHDLHTIVVFGPVILMYQTWMQVKLASKTWLNYISWHVLSSVRPKASNRNPLSNVPNMIFMCVLHIVEFIGVGLGFDRLCRYCKFVTLTRDIVWKVSFKQTVLLSFCSCCMQNYFRPMFTLNTHIHVEVADAFVVLLLCSGQTQCRHAKLMSSWKCTWNFVCSPFKRDGRVIENCFEIISHQDDGKTRRKLA